jgi:hypothetical protein
VDEEKELGPSEHVPDLPPFLLPAPHIKVNTDVLLPVQEAGLAIKNPPKKTHLKTHYKCFFLFFWVFLNFLFFMKIIQTFLFETDFL